MFAVSPFASTPFAWLGDNGPVFLNTKFDALGEAAFVPQAQWYHSASLAMSGDSTFDPYVQILRDSGFGDGGIATFTIHSMWNLTSTLEAKGYAEASFGFNLIHTTDIQARGIAKATMDGGFKQWFDVVMAGTSKFKTSSTSSLDTDFTALGLSSMVGYTAYKHATTTTMKGVGTFTTRAGRIISFNFNAKGIATVNFVAVFPGDDEGEMWARGLSTMNAVGYYTADFQFAAKGDSDTNFIINALYQGRGIFKGTSTMIGFGATKYSSVMRASGIGVAVFPTQFAAYRYSMFNAAGVGVFNIRAAQLYNSRSVMQGISAFILESQYAQKIDTVGLFKGDSTFLIKAVASADSRIQAVGDSTFVLRTQRILNSTFIARGVAIANMLPGNPLHQSLPDGQETYDRGTDADFQYEWTDKMFIANIYKQPIDRKDYDIDFKKWLLQRDPTDTLDAVDYSVYRIAGRHADTNPLNVDLIQLTTTTAKIWVSGGSPCSTYKIELTANTVRGRRDQSELIFIVEDK